MQMEEGQYPVWMRSVACDLHITSEKTTTLCLDILERLQNTHPSRKCVKL